MKKILLIILAIALILCLGSCGDGGKGNDKGGVDSGNVEISNQAGGLTIDEATVKELLSAFPEDIVGLSADVYDYTFILSETTLNGKPACKAEATIGKSKNAEAVFIIDGATCYRYDAVTKTYKLLTLDEAVDIDIQVGETEKAEPTETTTSKYKTDEQIAEENNDVLKNRYAKYDLKKIGLPKAITEYEFQVTGNQATASDGETVYVIYLLEDGQYTDFKFAIGSEKDYYFDTEDQVYKPLS